MEGRSIRGRSFWTLTIREYPYQMDEERFDYAQRIWHTMLRNLGKAGVRFSYIRVVELQERGTPHFHLAVNSLEVRGIRILETAMAHQILRRAALKAGFGPARLVPSGKVRTRGVASYLGKYLSKGSEYLSRTDGRFIRKYNRSRNWVVGLPKPRVWRVRKVGGIERRGIVSELMCRCGLGQHLNQGEQLMKWMARCIEDDWWTAPLDMYDYLMEKQKGSD